ncbi:MAG: alpha/beta hydrolase [Nocardioides sp.]
MPLVAVVVVAVMVLVIVAVALRADDLDPDPSAGPTDSPSAADTAEPPAASITEPPDPALAGFYAQSLDWQDCEEGHECATLEVPVDYDDPDAASIELALLRVPAGGERVGSLVVNPGGPGSPGTDYAAGAETTFRRPLVDAFDVVGFDPRGTGDSSPVDCLSDTALDDYLAQDPDPDTTAEGEAFIEQTRRIGAGCAELSPELAGHVTTVESARDMDVLRAALGEEQLTYLGASYGTKLGATYAELFPDRVGRLLLDGAVDVSLPSRDLALGQAGGFQTALEAYVEDCVEETEDCFLGESVDEGLQRIRDFLDEVDQQPLPTGTDRELTEGRARYGIITPLYVRDYWFLLTAGLRQGFAGNGAALLQLADLYASRDPDGAYANNSMEAFYAISCLDDPFAIGINEVEGQYADFEEASPTLGRFFAWALTGCGGWQVEPTEEPLEIHAEGAAPIVVVGTTRDPATPYEWAVGLADELESGVLVTRDGDGHTGYNSGNDCIDEAVEAYLIEGTVPEGGLSC